MACPHTFGRILCQAKGHRKRLETKAKKRSAGEGRTARACDVCPATTPACNDYSEIVRKSFKLLRHCVNFVHRLLAELRLDGYPVRGAGTYASRRAGGLD